MEWYLKIPKILHLYWGGEKLSYIRFLTVKTFLKYNPDWKIIFLTPTQYTKTRSWITYENKEQSSDYTDFFPELKKLPIEFETIDMNKYYINNNIPEVHKSDFIRLIQLHQIGGLWSDMDIIYLKSMNNFYLNRPENRDIETFICNNEYGHSIGFMMGSEGNKFFQSLSNLALGEYDSHFYQTLGAKLYNKHFSTTEAIERLSSVMNISMDVVYPVRAGNEKVLLDTKPINITEKTLGIHWFAGHPQWNNFSRITDGGLNVNPNTIIGKLIKSEQYERLRPENNIS